MPALMCSRAVFVSMDDLFLVCRSKGLCLNQLRKKTFNVMDVLDAQAQTCAVLFLRCCEHGTM